MKVIFQHKSGRKQAMQRRYADILKNLKRGTYETRDMRAAEVVPPKEIKDEPKEAVESKQIEAGSPKKAARAKSRKAEY